MNSIFELIVDAPNLTGIVVCITSGNRVVQGLLRLTHELVNLSLELFLVDVFVLHPFLDIWGEVIIHERLGIFVSVENILLEFLERGTINDDLLGGGRGDQSHIG